MTEINPDLLPEPLPPPHRGWRTGDLVRAAIIIFTVWFVFQLVWSVYTLVFLVFLATLFGLATAEGVNYLARYKIRRGIASAIIVLGTLGLIGLGLRLAAPTLIAQSSELQRELPDAIEKGSQWLDKKRDGLMGTIIKQAAAPPPPPAPVTVTTQTANGVTVPITVQPVLPESLVKPKNGKQSAAAAKADSAARMPSAQVKQRVSNAIAGASRHLFSFVTSTIAVAGAFVLLVFLAMYIGAEPDVYRAWMLAAVPAVHRAHARLLIAETSKVLRKWLVTQMIAMLVIGGVTTIALLVLHVKAAIALGFIAGLLEFIPTVGPILSAVPAVAMGFADSPSQALTIALVYWGIQFIENNLLIPWLMRGEMDLPPAITLVAQTLMTLVFGFIGLMVAVPVTAAVLVPLRLHAERENAREKEMIKLAKLQGEQPDPTPPLSEKPPEVTLKRADAGPKGTSHSHYDHVDGNSRDASSNGDGRRDGKHGSRTDGNARGNANNENRNVHANADNANARANANNENSNSRAKGDNARVHVEADNANAEAADEVEARAEAGRDSSSDGVKS